MLQMTELKYSRQALQNLVNSFTSLSAIPGSYSPLLLPLYREVGNDPELNSEARTICQKIFKKWEDEDDEVEEEVVQRCLDMWLTINGEDHILKKPPPRTSNIKVQEAEVSDYVDGEELERVEFDSVTNQAIDDPLRNLIIEEVEATEFVAEDDDMPVN